MRRRFLVAQVTSRTVLAAGCFDLPALRSQATLGKDATKSGVDGEPLHNFQLCSAIPTRDTVVFDESLKIETLVVPTPTQRRALEPIGALILVTLEVGRQDECTDS